VVDFSAPDQLPAVIGYIDPGTGFILVGTVLPYLYAALAAVAGVLVWPLRWCWRRYQRWYHHFRTRRVILLGFDGMDPVLAEQWMAEGKLPNLAQLRASGSYQRLATTTPPESPVAWSSFLTGRQPGEHGVYDFIKPDFATYLPHLATGEIEQTARWFALNRLRFPVQRARATTRTWQPFYQTLAAQGVPVMMLRQPLDFPVSSGPARVLAALGVTDLRGRQGDYRLLCAGEPPAGVPAEKVIRLDDTDTPGALLPGPRLADGTADLAVQCTRTAGELAVRVGGATLVLKPGQWSPLTDLAFSCGRGTRLRGLVTFYLVRLQPLTLYVSPVMPHPDEQAFPFVNPRSFGTALWKRHGNFHTLGMAEPNEAYKDGALDATAFLAANTTIRLERERMLLAELARWRDGLLGTVFDLPDRVQHLFWREMENRDPLLGRVIERSYQQLDAFVGEVRSRLTGDDLLLVFSDHGFAPFRREFHLNRWLADSGYLSGPRSERFFTNVNWQATRAYGLGFCGLYLNRTGREQHGIVTTDTAATLAGELRQKLLAYRDPASGEQPVNAVYLASEVYQGAAAADAPDLVIGCARGWRISAQSALGGVSDCVVSENRERWSGDHCIDPALVPGVFFASHPGLTPAGISDFAALVPPLFRTLP